jgi:transcriptional regulator with XRE-family HTH domain
MGSLGARLRKLWGGERTQQEVADFLGISRARLSHYENDRVEIDNDLLQRMSEFYRVSIDYLVGGELKIIDFDGIN